MKKYGAYITLKQLGYLEVEAENEEEAIDKAYDLVDEAETVGDEDYEIEVEELEPQDETGT